MYAKIVRVFMSEVTDKPISEEMVKEKENIFAVIEDMISQNNLKDAEELLTSLEDIFKLDGKIYNYKGIICYIKQDYQNALENLALAQILMDEKFDNVFNIACVMENMNRVGDAKKFYELSYRYCNDASMKEQVKEILANLN